MTDLQEKMLHLQTISTIVNSDQALRNIATQEAIGSPNLDVEARVLYYKVLLGNMKQNLINEILNSKEFYTPLEPRVDEDNNIIFKK